MELLRTATGKMLVEAHRGAETVAPPNSWAAILAAVESGADLIELDVQITADEVPVIHHTYRLPGGGMLRATPSTDLEALDAGDGQPPPRLEAVLEWFAEQPAPLGLTLDIKNGFGIGVTPFTRVLELLARFEVTGRVMLASWDHMGLLWVKRHQPAVTTRALLRGNPLDLVALVKRAEVDAVALSYDLIDPADVEALHEVGIAVFLAELWEPNFRYPVQLGVDALAWGDPAEAIYALEQQAAR